MSTNVTPNARLHLLSPIHVGTGQELDPFSYTIHDGHVLLVDILRWAESHAEQVDLMAKMDTEDHAALRAYIAGNLDSQSDAVMDRIPVFSPNVQKNYSNALSGRSVQQQALINFMVRSEISRRAFIPGSSIKGAIRTALASSAAPSAGVSPGDGFQRKYEGKIFGPPTEDVLKHLKVADMMLKASATAVFEAIEHAFKANLTPKGAYEAVCGLWPVGKPVVYPLALSLKPFMLQNQRIDAQGLVDILNAFYVPKFKEEYRKFYAPKTMADIQRAMAPLCLSVAAMKSNEALIRIGHFSHVECVTLDGLRRPKTRRGRDGKPLPWGKTRTLVAGLVPFGWGKIEFGELPAQHRPEQEWPFDIEEVQRLAKTPFSPWPAGSKSSPDPEPQQKPEPRVSKPTPAPEREVWRRAVLTYAKNTQEVTATWEGKSASSRQPLLIPEELTQRLLAKKKRRPVEANVEVVKEGNKLTIAKIQPLE